MYLNTHSYYSLRYGTLSIESMLAALKAAGHEAAAITDINNSTGVLDFVRLANEAGIKAVPGMEIREGNKMLFTGIALNNKGFCELNELITHHNISGSPLPKRPTLNHCVIIYPLGALDFQQLREHEYIGIRPGDIARILFEPAVFRSKMVAFPSLTFIYNDKDFFRKKKQLSPVQKIDEEGWLLHQHLRAIDCNTLISKLDASETAREDECLYTTDELKSIYQAVPELLLRAQQLLDSCSFAFDFKAVKNKKLFTDSAYEDKLLLEKLALEGIEYRYGSDRTEAEKRIQSELEIIDKMGFSANYLITWDIVRYSMSKGFYHIGRGSGANSVVAYCLRITDVCPIELNLYFERFLNPKRKSPPDFDVDYSWKERDNVLQYIFDRYGKDRTALLGTISNFRDKATLRELGKVQGLPKHELDRLVYHREDDMNQHSVASRILQMAKRIEDFPNMRSIHAGDVLISELPLTNYVALDLPPKNFPTVQFDMYLAEEIGFEKLDILSQRGIGHIKECAELVKQNKGIAIDVHNVAGFKKDKKINEVLKAADTIGCFYIESPAMRGLLTKLRCDNYLSLVAASSIIRPGVASSGMMKEFIFRFNNPDKFQYLHPLLKEHLSETHGVMVYQEDVLKVGHYFGGLDLADADVLRRMMSGKTRNRRQVEEIEKKFFDHCHSVDYADAIAREVWRQIESFAGFSFSKAHSASYAVESYQSLFLKTYYPHEFIVAVINNFGGYYATRIYVHQARKMGAVVHLPCVNNSVHYTSLRDNNIYLGFIHVQNLEEQLIHRILQERDKRGMYKNIEDFVKRTTIKLEQLIILIRLNALRFTGKNKKELLWEAHLLLSGHAKQIAVEALFETPRVNYQLPTFVYDPVEDIYDEIELLGFSVSVTDFDLLRTPFRGEITAKEFIQYVGKRIKLVGSLVLNKKVWTKNGALMYFGTWLDAAGDFFDTVHFPDSLMHNAFAGNGLYLIFGKVTEEFGVASIEVERMAKLPLKSDPRSD